MSELQCTILGEGCRMGTYLLFIRLKVPLLIPFGRFRGGRPVEAPEGDYVYVGSALGERASGSPLALRLLRHASRSGKKPAHPIRRLMLREFRAAGLTNGPSVRHPLKHLRWHVDYLLERREAELFRVMAIRSPLRLEDTLSVVLNTHPAAEALAPRLGAQDRKQGAHLLRLYDTAAVMADMENAMLHLTGN
jgi:Uri superfamily endonuclease